MFAVPVQDLLEAGVHFGCRASRWNPKMAPYIFGKRNLIHIIDLRETLRGMIRATTFLQRLVAEGQQVLFVGTKRQAAPVIAECATSVGMPYVAERWLGGTLTNFNTIRSRLSYLAHLESLESSGALAAMAKKEAASILRERRKVFRNLNGIRNMERLPGALVVVDPRREHNAVREANRLGIPAIGILDTDCDPDPIDIPIPANDDSMRAIQIILKKLTEAVAAGTTAFAQYLAEEEKRRAEDDARRAEEQKKLEEAQRRRAAEREALRAAQEKLRREREAQGATPAPVAEPSSGPAPEAPSA
jgi:small subunit ribosomal protein S2